MEKSCLWEQTLRRVLLFCFFCVLVAGASGSGVNESCQGSLCVIYSSHPTRIEIVEIINEENENSPTLITTEDLVTGKNEICIKKEGAFNVIPSHDCFQFNKEKFPWNSYSPVDVEIQVTKYRIQGPVVAPERTSAEDLSMQILSSTGTTISAPITRTGRFFFGYQYWTTLEESLELSPNDKSGELLFYPKSQKIKISDALACPANTEIFVGRPGMFIKGVIEPGENPMKGVTTVAGVNVVVSEKISGRHIFGVYTDETGEYSLGPLYDDIEYEVGVRKGGMYFEESEKGFFAFLFDDHPVHITAEEIVL